MNAVLTLIEVYKNKRKRKEQIWIYGEFDVGTATAHETGPFDHQLSVPLGVLYRVIVRTSAAHLLHPSDHIAWKLFSVSVFDFPEFHLFVFKINLTAFP